MMLIKNIELKGLRNYQEAKAQFGEGINLIAGSNAQGKTNLLEAIYFLTGAKSFRTRRDSELIGFKEEHASVISDFFSRGREQRLEIYLKRKGRKRIVLNGVKKKSAADIAGCICAILFCPSDLEIVRGPASERRKFIDSAICQLRPKYVSCLSEFNRLYEHKVRILRDFKEKPGLLKVLDDFNMRLAKTGAELIYYRASWCGKLSVYASKIHREISGCGEELEIIYKSYGISGENQSVKPSEIYSLLMEHQKEHRQAEIDSGMCLSGAQKDDLIININSRPAKGYASQGQIRTSALSLKLAEREISFRDMGEYPILLLDDVLSELDPQRQEFVLNKISGGQVFISCCDGEEIEKKTGGRIYKIVAGRFI
jgi:DNA replication and repair protein RecF